MTSGGSHGLEVWPDAKIRRLEDAVPPELETLEFAAPSHIWDNQCLLRADVFLGHAPKLKILRLNQSSGIDDAHRPSYSGSVPPVAALSLNTETLAVLHQSPEIEEFALYNAIWTAKTARVTIKSLTYRN
ncbi:hypothetical protein FRB97_003265 [Tulasnella sp. 331]|nr:hypothetical protein FRB97_003265 [Tulasnella sp. 331]